MPNTSTGVNTILELDSTIIGAQTSATLDVPQELRELITKQENGFISHLSGKQEWSVSNSSFILNTNSDAFISTGNAQLELSVDGGTTYDVMPRLDSIEIELTQNLAEEGGLDRPLWRYLNPAERGWTMEIEGAYFEPEEDDGVGGTENTVFGDLLENKGLIGSSDTTVMARLTIDQMTLEGDVALGDMSIEGETGGEKTTLTLSFGGDGELIKSGTPVDPSIDKLFEGYFDSTEYTVIFDVGDLDHTYEGTGYLDTLTVSLTDGEEATIEVDIAGNGPIAYSADVV